MYNYLGPQALVILVASCRTVVQDKRHGVWVTFRHTELKHAVIAAGGGRRTRVGRGRKKNYHVVFI